MPISCHVTLPTRKILALCIQGRRDYISEVDVPPTPSSSHQVSATYLGPEVLPFLSIFKVKASPTLRIFSCVQLLPPQCRARQQKGAGKSLVYPERSTHRFAEPWTVQQWPFTTHILSSGLPAKPPFYECKISFHRPSAGPHVQS